MRSRFFLKIFSFLFLVTGSNLLFAQDSIGRKLPFYSTFCKIDTLNATSRKLTVTYTLSRTMVSIGVIQNMGDLIFDNNANTVSRLFMTDNKLININLATIPIDNIVIDDVRELILVLSRAMESPYNIVLYNFKGELLFKKKILPFELVMDSADYVEFSESFSIFFNDAISKEQILKEGNRYYIDLGYWRFLSEAEKEKITAKNWFKPSHFFPDLFRESFGTHLLSFNKYVNFYSNTDPFYEYEISNFGKPIGIILNDEFGGKVKIPLTGYVKVAR